MRLFKKDRKEGLFTLPSANISLEVKLGLKINGSAIAIKESTGTFKNVIEEIRELLKISKDLVYKEVKDRYGYIWFIIFSNSIEDLVAIIDAVADTVIEHGFKESILAAIFKYNNTYLIYRFKDNKFYPFIPYNNKRDHEEEMRVYAILKEEIPIEHEIDKWYPIWDIPL